MPSGKSHDLVTLLLTPAAFAVGLAISHSYIAAIVAAIGFIFGATMFGPDLDTNSKQYARWSIFKPIWLPYRSFFKHRSRWTHGLLFGSLLRVIYFFGVLTLLAYAVAFIYTTITGGETPGVLNFAEPWRDLGDLLCRNVETATLIAFPAGIWAGAASHTMADIAGTFIKTGKVGDIF